MLIVSQVLYGPCGKQGAGEKCCMLCSDSSDDDLGLVTSKAAFLSHELCTVQAASATSLGHLSSFRSWGFAQRQKLNNL